MNDKHDRRKLITKPLQWAAATTLLGSLDASLLARPAAPADAPRSGVKSIYRMLGKTGVSLPIVSMAPPPAVTLGECNSRNHSGQ
jgi:hypothetical protein